MRVQLYTSVLGRICTLARVPVPVRVLVPSTRKYEFAPMPMAAVHITTSPVRVRVTVPVNFTGTSDARIRPHLTRKPAGLLVLGLARVSMWVRPSSLGLHFDPD